MIEGIHYFAASFLILGFYYDNPSLIGTGCGFLMGFGVASCIAYFLKLKAQIAQRKEEENAFQEIIEQIENIKKKFSKDINENNSKPVDVSNCSDGSTITP